MTRKTGCLFVATSGDLAGIWPPNSRSVTQSVKQVQIRPREEVGHCLSEECQLVTVGVQSCSFRIVLLNHKLGQKILAGRVTLLYECFSKKNSPIHSNYFSLSLCCRKMFFSLHQVLKYRKNNLIKCKFNGGVQFHVKFFHWK